MSEVWSQSARPVPYPLYLASPEGARRPDFADVMHSSILEAHLDLVCLFLESPQHLQGVRRFGEVREGFQRF